MFVICSWKLGLKLMLSAGPAVCVPAAHIVEAHA